MARLVKHYPPLPPAGPNVKRPPAPAPTPEPVPLLPVPQDSCLQIQLKEFTTENPAPETDIVQLCSDSPLPKCVTVTESFRTDGCSILIEKGETLLLHYVVKEVQRVHGMDADRVEYWIPVHHKQKYERLPLDPRHDEKRYRGLKALAEAKPIPNVVRVTEAHYADNPNEMAEVDDIVVISHVEIGRDSEGNPRKVVVAKIGNQDVRLGEDLTFAEFSTMLSDEFLPMSELIKFDFPQRVRVLDMEAQIRNKRGEKILKLLSYEKEHHIICTRPDKKEVISIPLTCPIKLQAISSNWAACKKALPPLYSLVNYTWNVQDLGRRNLPDNYRQIAQPHPDVIKDWLVSHEGKIHCVEVANKYVKSLRENINELKRENSYYMARLSAEKSKEEPMLPRRMEGIGLPPPARPPKSDSLRRTKSALPVKISQKTSSMLPNRKKDKNMQANTPDQNEGNYESPIDPGSDDGIYETLPETTTATTINSDVIAELKILLEKKEEVIRNAKITEDHLKKRVERLEKEKEQLEKKNHEYACQVRSLHIELDRSLQSVDQSGENVYDSIDQLTPVDGNSQIYNCPADLRGVKVMTVKDVGDMLHEIHLGQYAEVFEKEAINGDLLESLEDNILKEDLGMTGLHARKLMVAIKQRTNKI